MSANLEIAAYLLGPTLIGILLYYLIVYYFLYYRQRAKHQLMLREISEKPTRDARFEAGVLFRVNVPSQGRYHASNPFRRSVGRLVVKHDIIYLTELSDLSGEFKFYDTTKSIRIERMLIGSKDRSLYTVHSSDGKLLEIVGFLGRQFSNKELISRLSEATNQPIR